MKQLKDQDSVVRLLGKNTILKFVCLVDSVATYETIVPKFIDGNLTAYRLDVFHHEGESLLDYETVSDITYNRQVFELKVSTPKQENYELLYHNKYNDPSAN